jgi:hypothetical protein
VRREAHTADLTGMQKNTIILITESAYCPITFLAYFPYFEKIE